MNGREMSTTTQESEKVSEVKAEYITGWLTRQLEAGRKPKYGYPANHLPEVPEEPVSITTSFITALEAEAKAR